MPTGDPPSWPWNDAIGYLPLWMVQQPLGQPFERILVEHAWELYARDERSALWFWECNG